MVEKLRHIPRSIKKSLVEEAGRKCANPGCSQSKTHIHHIRHWAVYKAHDKSHMIAVCPTCHNAIHHGELKIDDDTLYRWKKIQRGDPDIIRDQFYIEPSKDIALLAGEIRLISRNAGMTIFQLSSGNLLKFRILDSDTLLISSQLSNLRGEKLLKIEENYVAVPAHRDIKFVRRPGKIQVEMPSKPEYISSWTVEKMRLLEPDYGINNRVTALDIEVLNPGLARIMGIWHLDSDMSVIITAKAINFVEKLRAIPVCMCGDGVNGALITDGPITQSLFNIRR